MILASDTPIAVESPDGNPSIFRAIQAVIESLDALSVFICELSEVQYTAAPPNGSSSVGSHTRHCLDHVEALLRGLTDGVVDYDHRKRGTDVEHSKNAALCRVSDLRNSLERAAPVNERYLCVCSMTTPDGDSVRAHSSWSRELVFVLSHTIHHQAMMAAAAQALGAIVSSRFGCAPSTLAYRDQTPCVRSA